MKCANMIQSFPNLLLIKKNVEIKAGMQASLCMKLKEEDQTDKNEENAKKAHCVLSFSK